METFRRGVWVTAAEFTVLGILVVALAVGVWIGVVAPSSSTTTTPVPPGYPLPPVWTSVVPGDSAFGGVVEYGAYYTIVPMSALPTVGPFQFAVVALSLGTGAVEWQSPAITVANEGNVPPQLVAGAGVIFLVGDAQPITSIGAAWNGSSGVFAIALNASTGALGAFTVISEPTYVSVQDVVTWDGSVYVGAQGGASDLRAFPLPADPQVGANWSAQVPLPPGFDSNLAITVEDGFVLILGPAEVLVVSALTGALLEQIPSADPLDLFDGTVVDGIAWGVAAYGSELYLQGFELTTGTLVTNESLGPASNSVEPFVVRSIGNQLFFSVAGGTAWAAYNLSGALEWSSPEITAGLFISPPIPVGSSELLFYGGSPPSGSFGSTGNVTFPVEFDLVDRTTGSIVWAESRSLQEPADTVLFPVPSGEQVLPGPYVEAAEGSSVIYWWDDSTILAGL